MVMLFQITVMLDSVMVMVNQICSKENTDLDGDNTVPNYLDTDADGDTVLDINGSMSFT